MSRLPLVFLLMLGACASSSPTEKPATSTDDPALVDSGESEDSAEPVNERELHPGIHSLDGLDPDMPRDDLAPLSELIGTAQVVALGESIHYSGGYHQVRARIIPYLVEVEGMRVVAFEGPWGAAEATRAYIEDGEGTLYDAMVGLYFSVWQSPSTAHTIAWLRAWNVEHPDDPVQFHGFDIQQPWHDSPWLRGLLRDAHPEPYTLLAGMEPCVAGAIEHERDFWATDDGIALAAGTFPIPGLTERTDSCIAGLTAVNTWLDANPELVNAARSADDLVLARVAIVAMQAAHQQFGGAMWDVETWDARDAGMAAVFQLLWQERSGGQRAVIWAHNGHIVKDGGDMEDYSYPANWVDMGTILADTLGEDYAPIGLIASEVAWSWPGMEDRQAARNNSLERHLEELGAPWLLIDLPVATADGTVIEEGVAYPAGQPAQATFRPVEHYRGLVYLQSSPAMEFWRE